MNMTSEEFNQLEKLINKLTGELGGNPICILNGQIADGWHIGIYEKSLLKNNKPCGEREIGRTATAGSLESAAKKIQSIIS